MQFMCMYLTLTNTLFNDYIEWKNIDVLNFNWMDSAIVQVTGMDFVEFNIITGCHGQFSSMGHGLFVGIVQWWFVCYKPLDFPQS